MIESDYRAGSCTIGSCMDESLLTRDCTSDLVIGSCRLQTALRVTRLCFRFTPLTPTPLILFAPAMSMRATSARRRRCCVHSFSTDDFSSAGPLRALKWLLPVNRMLTLTLYMQMCAKLTCAKLTLTYSSVAMCANTRLQAACTCQARSYREESALMHLPLTCDDVILYFNGANVNVCIHVGWLMSQVFGIGPCKVVVQKHVMSISVSCRRQSQVMTGPISASS